MQDDSLAWFDLVQWIHFMKYNHWMQFTKDGFCISTMGLISLHISDGPNGAFTKKQNRILHAGVNALLFRWNTFGTVPGFRNTETLLQ